MDTSPNTLDVLIVDEAHRLNEKSGFYQNQGENQIKEIIRASKCSIFFLDQDQRVTFKDIGDRDEIRRWAVASTLPLIHEHAVGQPLHLADDHPLNRFPGNRFQGDAAVRLLTGKQGMAALRPIPLEELRKNRPGTTGEV